MFEPWHHTVIRIPRIIPIASETLYLEFNANSCTYMSKIISTTVQSGSYIFAVLTTGAARGEGGGDNFFARF